MDEPTELTVTVIPPNCSVALALGTLICFLVEGRADKKTTHRVRFFLNLFM